MALLIDLYEALKETAGEEKARRAIENLEAHIKEIKEEQATKDDIKLLIEQMNLRFEEVNQRFEEVNRRFEEMDRRFEAIDRKFEVIDRRFEVIDRRFEEIDRRFEVVEKRLNFIQWFIALGFTLITVIMTLYRFFG